MVLLIRFGELALKSRFVRRQLRDRLVGNIQDMFATAGVECITEMDEARIYVHTADPERARGILGRVFGIVSASPAKETRADLGSLTALVVEEARGTLHPSSSFALRTRRSGTHPFTSQDLAREIGEAVRQAIPGVRVDLSHPDQEIYIEVRQNRGFVFREIWPGPGGLPLGSQGRGLAFVEGDAGMVAAWMGMKRGCRIAIAARGPIPQVDALVRWDTHLKVLEATSLQDLPELVRIARADALFLGTRLREFDSSARAQFAVPVFEPVIGLPESEIQALASRILSV